MINKENKSDIIISSILGVIYSLIFSFLLLGGLSNLMTISYVIISIVLTGLIATDIKSKKEDYFTSNLIKKLVLGFVFGWILWPGFGELVGPIIGFYLASKKKVEEGNFSFQKYAWIQFKKNKSQM